MKFSKTKTDDNNDKNEANNNWEDGTEALPYEVLEKRFVSTYWLIKSKSNSQPINYVIGF